MAAVSPAGKATPPFRFFVSFRQTEWENDEQEDLAPLLTSIITIREEESSFFSPADVSLISRPSKRLFF